MAQDRVECCSSYGAVRSIARLALRLFFQDVVVVNQDRVPRGGPVVLVANHANQFVDAMVLLHACPRPVSFMIAEKSLHRPIIGPAARGVGAVGVVRAQDEKARCDGVITAIDCEAGVVRGEGTTFASQELCNSWNGRPWAEHGRAPTLSPGDKLLAEGGSWAEGDSAAVMKLLVVEEVLSDTELRVKPVRLPDGSYARATVPEGGIAFRAMPRLAMRGTLRGCARHVAGGGTFGIFPEGGSHDQSSLLPLKNGVALVSLMATYAGDVGDLARRAEEVRIVPCGITYFHGHRFRSSVMVEFGEPVAVDAAFAARYAADDRSAAPAMLERVREALESVTLNVLVTELRQVFNELKDDARGGVGKDGALRWAAVRDLIAPVAWADGAERPAVMVPLEVLRIFDGCDGRGFGFLEYVEFKAFADKLAQAVLAKARGLGLRVVPAILTEHDGMIVQQILALARALYTPAGRRLRPDEQLQLSRNFAEGYNRLRASEEGRALLRAVGDYWLRLKAVHATDEDVLRSPSWKVRSAGGGVLYAAHVAAQLVAIVLCAAVSLPGILLWLPVARLCRARAERARVAAVKGSSVKIKGRDTIASAKVVEGFKLVPLFYLLYGTAASILTIFLAGAGTRRFLYAAAVWLLFPWYAYLSIRLYDVLVRNVKSVLGALRVTLAPADDGSMGRTLVDEREHLRRRIVRFVRDHVGEIEGMEDRLVLPEVLEDEASLA